MDSRKDEGSPHQVAAHQPRHWLQREEALTIWISRGDLSQLQQVSFTFSGIFVAPFEVRRIPVRAVNDHMTARPFGY